MGSLALTSSIALVASLVLTAIVRRFARRWGIVDRPDGRRKLHGMPIPLWGGVAVYGATALGLLAAHFGSAAVSPEFTELSTAWMIAAGFVCFVGSIDDRFDLPSRLKLGLQIIAVLPIVMYGYCVDRVVAFGVPIELGWLGIPLTVLWLLGCINALNLIDGMDGLASIVGLSTTVMMGVIAASEGHGHVAAMAIVLAAALLGFLMYNLPPASVFLGDSGSMVIGLSVGLLGIQGTLKTSATLAITAPVVVMTLPMFDIIAAVVRRKLTGRRFDSPDRLHIHHRLLDRGWTPWQVLCLIGAVCLASGAAATAATIFRLDVLAWVAAMSLIVLMVRLRLFGYEEFAMAKRAVVRIMRSSLVVLARLASRLGLPGSGIQGVAAGVTGQVAASAVHQVSMREPRTLNSHPWDILIHSVRAWDVRRIEFCWLGHGDFRRIRWIDPTESTADRCCWSLSVSLPDPSGELCELRASSSRPIIDDAEFAALTSLLKTFGEHFAANVDQILGPAPDADEPVAADRYSDGRRKAA